MPASKSRTERLASTPEVVDLLQIVKTKKTELLFLARFMRLLKPGGRAAVIVPDGELFGSSKAHQELRRILVEEQKLDADGWSLDDKRNELLPAEKLGPTPPSALTADDHAKNNLPDVLARWSRRDADGNAPLTRLTVLRKWFERPGRLSRFGLWVARRAAGRKGKTKGEHSAPLQETSKLLGPASTRESFFAQPERRATQDLYDRARASQAEFEKQTWGPVRVVNSWPLLLVEQGLAIYLCHADSPSHGYKLAADWAQNYDSRYVNGLNGPSRGKLDELVRFMFTVEALEEEQGGVCAPVA